MIRPCAVPELASADQAADVGIENALRMLIDLESQCTELQKQAGAYARVSNTMSSHDQKVSSSRVHAYVCDHVLIS